MTVLFRLTVSLGRGLLKKYDCIFFAFVCSGALTVVAKISSCSEKLFLIELVSYAVKRPGNRTP